MPSVIPRRARVDLRSKVPAREARNSPQLDCHLNKERETNDTLNSSEAQLVIPSSHLCSRELLMHAARHTAIIHTTRAQCVARHLPSLPLSVRKPRSARTPTRQPTLAISAPSWPRDSYRPVPIHRIPPAAARQPFRHRSRPLPISVVPPPPNPPVSHTVRYTRASLHLHKRGCARRKQRAAATEPQKGKNGNGANSKGSDDSGDKSG